MSAERGMTEWRANGVDYTINDPNIAEEFDPTKAYHVRDHVYYQGNLYVFVAEHAAGAWNTSHVLLNNVGAELANLWNANDTEATLRLAADNDLKSAITPYTVNAPGDTTYKVEQGEKICLIVTENSAARNVLILPYQSGDDYFRIENSGAGIYEFTAAKNGTVSFSGSGTFKATMGLSIAYHNLIKNMNEEQKVLQHDVNNIVGYDVSTVGDMSNIKIAQGEILYIHVVENSAARNILVAPYVSGDTYLQIKKGKGDYTFTAPKDGILGISGAGTFHGLIMKETVYSHLLSLPDTVNDLINDVGYYAINDNFVEGHYIKGTTVGATVELSGNAPDWVYFQEPIFIKAGTLIEINTKASGMCCVAINSTNDFGTAKVAVVANDNTKIKTYKYKAAANEYVWLSGLKDYTEAKVISIPGSLAEIVEGKTYTIKKDGSGDYSTYTGAMSDLANDSTPKTVYIYDGVYDIYEEIGGAEFVESVDPLTADWKVVIPVIPPNTKLIGCGNVTLTFNPPAEVIGSNEKAAVFSPLNVCGNAEIENIEIICTNCRYAIHDESEGVAENDDTVHKYKNVRAKKTFGTYGHQKVFAAGVGARSRWEFESCSFEGDTECIWSAHSTRSVELDLASIILNNCVMVSSISNPSTRTLIRFETGQYHLATRNIAKLNNCYSNGKVQLTGTASGTTRQVWDVTLLGCSVAGTDVNSSVIDNPYPFKVYE